MTATERDSKTLLQIDARGETDEQGEEYRNKMMHKIMEIKGGEMVEMAVRTLMSLSHSIKLLGRYKGRVCP